MNEQERELLAKGQKVSAMRIQLMEEIISIGNKWKRELMTANDADRLLKEVELSISRFMGVKIDYELAKKDMNVPTGSE